MGLLTDRKIEHKGYGFIDIYQKNPEQILLLVENESDCLLAASLVVQNTKDSYHVQFTDRRSINFDITNDVHYIEQYKKLVILGSNIDKYSIRFLNRLNTSYIYIGNPANLKDDYPKLYKSLKLEVGESVLVLEKESVTERVASYFNIKNEVIEQVICYTKKLYPNMPRLREIIKYQYLQFILTPIEYFSYFYDNKIEKEKELKIEEYYKADLNQANQKLEDIIIKTINHNKVGFVQGGCPCNLILNLALQRYDLDVCVNVCAHRRHFTILCRKANNVEVLQKATNFLFSKYGMYSGEGYFGNQYSIGDFVHAFENNIAIHGFKNDRVSKYEEFDAGLYEWIPFINGTKLYKNFNFTIFVDTVCNADCKFCIEQIKTNNSGLIIKEGEMLSGEKYLKRLDEIMSRIRKYNPSISITGGEPLMSPVIRDVLKIVKKYNFRKVILTTNGTNILELVDDIIDSEITHVNFSRPFYNDEVSKRIMRFREKYVPFDDLKEAIRKLENGNVQTRMNCILSKEGIQSLDDAKKYIDYAYSLGCKHIIFRELLSFNEITSKNEEKKEYTKNNRVFVNDMWAQMDDDEDFAPYANNKGHYYYIEIYKYKDKVTIVSERTNIQTLEDEKKFNLDYVYEMVFHPNGRLCAGWDETKNIIEL